MFLWRIVANVIPTKENLQRRIPIHDTCCALCEQESKSSILLFLECPAVKALWYSYCKGFKPKDHHLTTIEGFIKLMLNSPKAPCPLEKMWIVSLHMALMLDEI